MKRNLLIILTLLITKTLLFVWLPFPNGDGPWSLSHTLSIIDGNFFQSTFGHSFISFYNLPYVSSLINVPFYFINLFGRYQIFVVNVIYLTFLLFLIRKYLYRQLSPQTKDFVFLLVSLTILTSTYTYSLRVELLIMIFMMLLLLFLTKRNFEFNVKNIFVASFLVSIIGLMHPVAGFFGFSFAVLVFYEKGADIYSFVKLGSLVLIWLLILYGPIVQLDFYSWKFNFFQRGYQEDYRGLQLSSFVKYLALTPVALVLIVLHFYFIHKTDNVRKVYIEIAYLLLFIFLLFAFSRSYYYPYLIIFLVYRISIFGHNWNLSNNKTKWISMILLVAPIFTHYLPTAQLVENPEYAKKWNEILDHVEEEIEADPNRIVWVSPYMGGTGMFYSNTRMHFSYYNKIAGGPPSVSENDLLLAEQPSSIAYLKRFYENKELELIELVQPTKGLFRLEFPLRRSEEIGLWRIAVNQ